MRKSCPPRVRYRECTPEIPLTVRTVAVTSNGRLQGLPAIETPPLTSRSIAVKAKLSVFPSFQPKRRNAPRSFVNSCSALIPNPYLRVPTRRTVVTSGTLPKRMPFLEFHHVATVAKYAPVKAQAISDSRFGRASVSDGPILQVKFVN